MNNDTAAVIVAYRSGAELPSCLAALEGKVAQAVVVSNDAGASAPSDLRLAHPWVDWIDNEINRGFAAAVNQGVAATSEPFVLLLNPDCELLSSLDGLISACGMPGVAGAGGLLLDSDGSPQIGFFARSLPSPWALAFESLGLNRVWKRNPVNSRYRLLHLNTGTGREVGQPAAALLALRRAALESVGGLDERFYPVWWEDVDLCRRLVDAGYKLRFTPSAVARHIGGHSVRSLSRKSRLQAWYGGMLQYSEKHHAQGAYRCVRLAVLAGLALRGLICRFAGAPGTELHAYRVALRSARYGFRNRGGSD